jgi:hypothetical protein
MALIGELTDYAKNTGGIRDYLNWQYPSDTDSDSETVGIGGYTAFAQVSEKFSRSAKVPTTFLEDGSHVNDHIIREPLTVSIEGNVSDVYAQPSAPVAAFQEAQTQVGNITQYAPARTQAQLSRVSGLVNDFTNAVDRVDAAIDATQGAAKYLGLQDSEAQTNIEAFLKKMEGLQATDKLIKISTSFKNYTDMYITSLEVTRDNQSKAISFNLEAQKVRIAQTSFTKTTAAQNAAIATNGQTDGETDKGAQEGEEVEESLSTNLGQMFGWIPE